MAAYISRLKSKPELIPRNASRLRTQNLVPITNSQPGFPKPIKSVISFLYFHICSVKPFALAPAGGVPLTTVTFDTALFAQVSLQKFNVPQLSFIRLKKKKEILQYLTTWKTLRTLCSVKISQIQKVVYDSIHY